jgi:mannose-6-phosphate isomerase-like protein (cupin superfamily)
MMNAINLEAKYALFQELWTPKIIADLNDQHIKLAKVKGEMIWHSHENEDELFVVIRGTLIMDFRDRTIEVKSGEILVVPKGVEHRPRTNGEEVWLMLVEPKSTKHTGEIEHELTQHTLERI